MARAPASAALSDADQDEIWTGPDGRSQSDGSYRPPRPAGRDRPARAAESTRPIRAPEPARAIGAPEPARPVSAAEPARPGRTAATKVARAAGAPRPGRTAATKLARAAGAPRPGRTAATKLARAAGAPPAGRTAASNRPPPGDPDRGVPGRRTVTIRGQVAPRPAPRRPPRGVRERTGSRPDRIAMWAVLLGVLLILVAATSSHAAIRTRVARVTVLASPALVAPAGSAGAGHRHLRP
jgi:hypothetical protein